MDLNSNISSIMTKEVECVSPDQKLIDVKRIYENSEFFHHHIPVVDNDILVGMVSLVDFMRKIQYASLDDTEAVYHNSNVSDIMSPNPISVKSETSIRAVAEMLGKGNIRAVVISDEGKVNGIATTADIIKFLLSQS